MAQNMFPMRILAVSDSSEPAALALRLAAEIANATGSELHVVQVAMVSRYVYPDILSDQQVERIRGEVEQKLDAEVARAETEGISIAGKHVAIGRSDAEVIKLAERLKVGLLVIGNRTEDAVRRILLGNDAESIVRHAHCPVLVARTDDP